MAFRLLLVRIYLPWHIISRAHYACDVTIQALRDPPNVTLGRTHHVHQKLGVRARHGAC